MVLTSREKLFQRWMLFSGVLYALGGTGFALGPLVLTNFLAGEKATVATTGAANPLVVATTSSFFWNALAVSMMATITVCALRAWKDPVAGAGFAVPVIVAKFVSSGMALATLLLDPGELTHTVPAIIAVTDLPLGLVTLYTYTMAKRSRAAALREGAGAPAVQPS